MGKREIMRSGLTRALACLLALIFAAAAAAEDGPDEWEETEVWDYAGALGEGDGWEEEDEEESPGPAAPAHSGYGAETADDDDGGEEPDEGEPDEVWDYEGALAGVETEEDEEDSSGKSGKTEKAGEAGSAEETAEEPPAGEAAGEAEELTARCRFSSNGNDKNYGQMTDGDLKTYLPLREKKKKKNGELVITCGDPIGGLEIMAFDKFGRDHDYEVQVRDGNEWKTVDRGGTYLVHWHALENPVTEVKIAATGKERLRIAEIRVFGPGEPPADVQRWETLGKCDLMLLTGHPDDEILWFAGLLPTYGGDRGYRVQVAVMVPTGGQRKLELLGAVWHCGVKYYPEMLGFLDKNGQEPKKQYELWKGKGRVLGRVAEAVRKHQPEVLVTHGEKGEYGHGAHKTAADAAKIVVKNAGKAKNYPKSAKAYGPWQVKKLYLHEYEKNPIVCDWAQPLEAFGGKTGYEVAEEAFAFHGSQVRRDWNFEIHGAHDNACFGLYYTAVGPDSGIGDLMEHVPAPAGE